MSITLHALNLILHIFGLWSDRIPDKLHAMCAVLNLVPTQVTKES